MESNSTAMMTDKKTQFPPGSLNYQALQLGRFGPDANATVELYVDEPGDKDNERFKAMDKEQLQREPISSQDLEGQRNESR